MFVLYCYESNVIITEPLKDRTGKEILQFYKKVHYELSNIRFKPATHWLDNEASEALKIFYIQQSSGLQLVPPHIHRRNAAVKSIRMWKNHLIAGLYGAEKNFNAPMVLPPQTIPNHIEPIEASKIKYKTFSANGTGG